MGGFSKLKTLLVGRRRTISSREGLAEHLKLVQNMLVAQRYMQFGVLLLDNQVTMIFISIILALNAFVLHKPYLFNALSQKRTFIIPSYLIHMTDRGMPESFCKQRDQQVEKHVEAKGCSTICRLGQKVSIWTHCWRS